MAAAVRALEEKKMRQGKPPGAHSSTSPPAGGPGTWRGYDDSENVWDDGFIGVSEVQGLTKVYAGRRPCRSEELEVAAQAQQLAQTRFAAGMDYEATQAAALNASTSKGPITTPSIEAEDPVALQDTNGRSLVRSHSFLPSARRAAKFAYASSPEKKARRSRRNGNADGGDLGPRRSSASSAMSGASGESMFSAGSAEGASGPAERELQAQRHIQAGQQVNQKYVTGREWCVGVESMLLDTRARETLHEATILSYPTEDDQMLTNAAVQDRAVAKYRSGEDDARDRRYLADSSRKASGEVVGLRETSSMPDVKGQVTPYRGRRGSITQADPSTPLRTQERTVVQQHQKRLAMRRSSMPMALLAQKTQPNRTEVIRQSVEQVRDSRQRTPAKSSESPMFSPEVSQRARGKGGDAVTRRAGEQLGLLMYDQELRAHATIDELWQSTNALPTYANGTHTADTHRVGYRCPHVHPAARGTWSATYMTRRLVQLSLRCCMHVLHGFGFLTDDLCVAPMCIVIVVVRRPHREFFRLAARRCHPEREPHRHERPHSGRSGKPNHAKVCERFASCTPTFIWSKPIPLYRVHATAPDATPLYSIVVLIRMSLPSCAPCHSHRRGGGVRTAWIRVARRVGEVPQSVAQAYRAAQKQAAEASRAARAAQRAQRQVQHAGDDQLTGPSTSPSRAKSHRLVTRKVGEKTPNQAAATSSRASNRSGASRRDRRRSSSRPGSRASQTSAARQSSWVEDMAAVAQAVHGSPSQQKRQQALDGYRARVLTEDEMFERRTALAQQQFLQMHDMLPQSTRPRSHRGQMMASASPPSHALPAGGHMEPPGAAYGGEEFKEDSAEQAVYHPRRRDAGGPAAEAPNAFQHPVEALEHAEAEAAVAGRQSIGSAGSRLSIGQLATPGSARRPRPGTRGPNKRARAVGTAGPAQAWNGQPEVDGELRRSGLTGRMIQPESKEGKRRARRGRSPALKAAPRAAPSTPDDTDSDTLSDIPNDGPRIAHRRLNI